MPEYARLGESTYFATTCRECPAGCGLIMRTFEGRAIKAEGNPNHPVNRGKLCSRGLVGVQGLYNPDRIKGPGKRAKRGDPQLRCAGLERRPGRGQAGPGQRRQGWPSTLAWPPTISSTWSSELAKAIGAPAPVRYGALGMFEGRATLVEACQAGLWRGALPLFRPGRLRPGDLLRRQFPGNLALAGGLYARLRQFRRVHATGKKRGYLVSFEARRSLTSGIGRRMVPDGAGQRRVWWPWPWASCLPTKAGTMPVSYSARWTWTRPPGRAGITARDS